MNNLLRVCPACSRSHTVTPGAIAFNTRQVLQLFFYFFFYFTPTFEFFIVSVLFRFVESAAALSTPSNKYNLGEWWNKKSLLFFDTIFSFDTSNVSVQTRPSFHSDFIERIDRVFRHFPDKRTSEKKNVFEVLGLRGNLGGELEFFELVVQLLEEIFEPRETFREKFEEQDPRLIKMFLHRLTFFFLLPAYRFETRERERERETSVPGNSSICYRFETCSVRITRRNFVSNGSVDCGKTLPSLSN